MAKDQEPKDPIHIFDFKPEDEQRTLNFVSGLIQNHKNFAVTSSKDNIAIAVTGPLGNY